MTDKKFINICFGDLRPYIERLIEYNVTNGLSYTDSFDEVYHPSAGQVDDARSLKLHLGLMNLRTFQTKMNLKIK